MLPALRQPGLPLGRAAVAPGVFSEDIWTARKGMGARAPEHKKPPDLIWTTYGEAAANRELDLPQPAPFNRPPEPYLREVRIDTPQEGAEAKKPQARARKPSGRVKLPAKKAENAEDRPRRLGRSIYDAVQTHGHFGLVDGGETLSGGIRRVIVHVPKRNRGYVLDIKQGDVIYANSAKGKDVRGILNVVFVSRNKYTPPGHAVSSCVIGIAEHEWERFMW
jgi:hypothetical protein